MNYEQILEKLSRLANGDDYNSPAVLASTLRALADEAEIVVLQGNKKV